MTGSSGKPAVSPARAVAFDTLLRIDQHDAYASELLHTQEAARLSAADHGLATELVMGVLRWRALLDHVIAELSSQKLEKLDPEVTTALRLGAYQLGFLERVPARAAINESVESVKRARKRSATGLVNAVLRKLSAQSPSFAESAQQWSAGNFASTPTPASLAEISSHPAWLVERWIEVYGIETANRI